MRERERERMVTPRWKTEFFPSRALLETLCFACSLSLSLSLSMRQGDESLRTLTKKWTKANSQTMRGPSFFDSLFSPSSHSSSSLSPLSFFPSIPSNRSLKLSSLCDALRHTTPAGAPPTVSASHGSAAAASAAAAAAQLQQAAAVDDGAVSFFFFASFPLLFLPLSPRLASKRNNDCFKNCSTGRRRRHG